LLKEMLEHLPDGLKEEIPQAMTNTQPNTELVKHALIGLDEREESRSLPTVFWGATLGRSCYGKGLSAAVR